MAEIGQAKITSLGCEIKRVRALECLRPSSAAELLLARCDDGGLYVTRMASDLNMTLRVAKELFANRLALLIGLPVREPALIQIPGGLYRAGSNHDVLEPRQADKTNEIHLGSSYPGTGTEYLVTDFLPRNLLSCVANAQLAFLGSVVFDLWASNSRRRKYIFTKPVETPEETYTAWLICNGHCFGWEAGDTDYSFTYSDSSIYKGARNMDSFEPTLSKVERLDFTQIRDCLKGIPEEWLAQDSNLFLEIAETLHDRCPTVRRDLHSIIMRNRRIFPSWG